MISYVQPATLVILICLSANSAKILRNKALMTKMVTNFHNDNEITNDEPQNDKSEMILTRMQNVLCKNFPSIPCKLIIRDNTLRKLIEKSIQELNYKKMFAERTTPRALSYLTLFPIINSEDLSNFIQVQDDAVAKNPRKTKTQEIKKSLVKTKNGLEKRIQKKKSKRTSLHSRKQLRKFYPHKVKYKEKVAGSVREEFGDRSEDRLSMSVEVPDMTLAKKHQHFAYKMEPAEPPVWRIDYMKHGEPDINMFTFNGAQRNLKTGPNVILDENVEVRKEVKHPDVYIKNNYVKKNSVVSALNSEPID